MKGVEDLVFIGEIVLQSKIARRAAERLLDARDNFEQVEVWCSIQSILCATANVSKILWPNSKYKERGKRLRQILKVQNENPLSNREFRNHFEHYDDRTEDWFYNYSGGPHIDLAMNPALGGNIDNVHRGYNSFNNTLIFRGEVLDLNRILEALEKIQENCRPYSII